MGSKKIMAVRFRRGLWEVFTKTRSTKGHEPTQNPVSVVSCEFVDRFSLRGYLQPYALACDPPINFSPVPELDFNLPLGVREIKMRYGL